MPTIQTPADLRGLDEIQLDQLAVELRDKIVRTVASTGGHLGPSLGVVELTIALHRLLDSPRDRIVWDTGHQAYAHKLLTGRAGTASRRCASSTASAASRAAARASTTSSTAVTPAPGCRSPSGWRRRATCADAIAASGSRSASATRRDERADAGGAQPHRPAPSTSC